MVQKEVKPLKCTFGVTLGRLLGYMVNQMGIEANMEKIKVIIEIRSLQKSKEV